MMWHRPPALAGAGALAFVIGAAGLPAQPASRSNRPVSTAARTPWGDPDLQGTYTNKYETSTPFERPKEFEGRRLEEVTRAELAVVGGAVVPPRPASERAGGLAP
jgi:hypothetical protein